MQPTCFVVTEDLKKFAQQALDSQCACNLSAIVVAYAGAIVELGKIYRMQHTQLGADSRNKCPIHILFATQISHLALGSSLAGDLNLYSEATKSCETLAKAEVNTQITIEW